MTMSQYHAFKSLIMGQTAPASAKICVEHFKLPIEPSEFQRATEEKLLETFETTQTSAMPGAPELVTQLHNLDFPISVKKHHQYYTYCFLTKPFYN